MFVTLESLLAWNTTRKVRSGSPPPVVTPPTEGSERVALYLGSWTAIQPFKHRWPDNYEEAYSQAFQATADVNGRLHVIVVGFAERTTAGMTDRARGTVFYPSPPKQRALVEFAGDGTLDTAVRYASVIKPDGSHAQLRSDAPVPVEYTQSNLQRAVSSHIIQGPDASNAIAVVVDTSNHDRMLDHMATHGVIRGVYKGWL